MQQAMEMTEEVWETAKRLALKMKTEHTDPRFRFLGGMFTIHVGIYGTFEIQVNSDGKIMKIRTPKGGYLKPPPEE